ncbi:hypothetical protein E4N62_13255 [Streptomyces sp. MNU76]|uniref:hypothetical protein n=1 Tax=Streptomyces sp. MNU76 TaxID=2560026 RepID=UPI001E496F61|nr:hypothetical protein [Streptomyces sp. MNU76]MCC9706149.1 hypothetical protein [Streptomyces sp. MNU76]
MNSEFLLGLIAAGAAFGGALLGAGGTAIAGRSQASAARYQADAPWIRELLPTLCAEFLLQAEQLYQDYQAMYEDAFQERWDEMERRARELDSQRLKRAFAALELRAPKDVVDTATALQQSLLYDHAPQPVWLGTVQRDRGQQMAARTRLSSAYHGQHNLFLKAARTALQVGADEAPARRAWLARRHRQL